MMMMMMMMTVMVVMTVISTGRCGVDGDKQCSESQVCGPTIFTITTDKQTNIEIQEKERWREKKKTVKLKKILRRKRLIINRKYKKKEGKERKKCGFRETKQENTKEWKKKKNNKNETKQKNLWLIQ